MPPPSAANAAIRLLSRREHSRQELRQKLAARGFGADDIAAALARLEESALQSDARFAAAYVRQKRGQLGDFRLRQDLSRFGVGKDDIAAAMGAECESPEDARAAAVLAAKFPQGVGAESAMRAHRFLRQRGFADDSAAAALAKCGQK